MRKKRLTGLRTGDVCNRPHIQVYDSQTRCRTHIQHVVAPDAKREYIVGYQIRVSGGIGRKSSRFRVQALQPFA